MSVASCGEVYELVVAEDGSIPADQVARVGAGPGTHLRVVPEQSTGPEGSVAGRLTGWPEVSWDEFDRASQLAQADLYQSQP